MDLSTLAFERRDPGGDDVVVCVANLAGMARHGYRVGLPAGGRWRAALDHRRRRLRGPRRVDAATCPPRREPWHGREHSVVLTLPALSVTYLVPS